MISTLACLALAAVASSPTPLELVIDRQGDDLVLAWHDFAKADGYRLFRSHDPLLRGSVVVHMTGGRANAPAMNFRDRDAALEKTPVYYWLERFQWTERHRGIAKRLPNERSLVAFAFNQELGSMAWPTDRNQTVMAGPLDPLYVTKSTATPTDTELWWQDDLTATGGYEIRRVVDKLTVPGMTPPPEPPPVPVHFTTGANPTFPVLDPNALSDPDPLFFYSVLGSQSTACVPGRDSDNDRLDDCVETNTGVFVASFDTGSDPNDPDTDDDGIEDGDETLGTLAGLDLRLLGSNPLRQDTFSEHDWMDDSRGSGPAHSHQPTDNEIAMVQDAYASGSLTNPDGSTGIFSHHDYGQGWPFTGGNFIDEPDSDIDGGVNGAEYQSFKDTHFDRALRQRYFFYVIHSHSYNNPGSNNGSSGQAEIGGNDTIVSTYSYGTEQINAGTIVHEQGHNFSLRHGGFENKNRKPNYNSTMNYNYQFNGVDTDCDAISDGRIDYARAERIDLDEANLDETRGVCGAVEIDWNCDSVIDTAVAWDLTCAANFCGCSGSQELLQDNDDWAQIDLPQSLANGDFAPLEIVDCQSGP